MSTNPATESMTELAEELLRQCAGDLDGAIKIAAEGAERCRRHGLEPSAIGWEAIGAELRSRRRRQRIPFVRDVISCVLLTVCCAIACAQRQWLVAALWASLLMHSWPARTRGAT